MEYRTKRLINEREILIIGPCPFEKDRTFQSLLKSLPILAIDKGADQLNQTDSLIKLGDGDSSKLEMDIKLNPIKNQSDLAVGLDFLGQNTKKVHLYGFLGLRKDHELINIGEIYKYVLKTGSTALVEDKISILPKGKNQLSINSTFSLLTLIDNEITLNGDCKYKLELPTRIEVLSSHGLSNEGFGKIDLNSTNPIILMVN
jgi:thiamine pyrophosphokinase